ncbi:MAG: cobalamin [Actinomycetia bacterium]|nr:cobalamin [Actinomycetes bacterium]
MHIPDGYLSPTTCAGFYAGMTPVWATAGRAVRRVVRTRFVPLLALGASYSFLVMMFNVPVPDGTTAHAVGAVLVAILLGPWAAVVAVSIALLIQALFFGDGGVLAYGANAWNMAFVMPMVGYGVYKLIARRCPLTARRRAVAAGVASYVGLNASALFAAIELGVQRDLFRSANGTPLYAPFPLWQTIPAMLLAHLLVAGVVEFALTFGVISYLQRANLPVLRINHRGIADRSPTRATAEPRSDSEPRPGPASGPAPGTRPAWRWAVVGLAAMVVLTPLGLLAGGGAFGEDAPRDLDLRKYGLQGVPRGLARYSGTWSRAVLDGYGFGSGSHPGVAYVLSAVVGLGAIGVIVFGGLGVGRVVSRRRSREVA